MAEKIGTEIKISRITSKQKNRSNYETNSAEYYYILLQTTMNTITDFLFLIRI
jgi:hypothetical protein